MANPDLDRIRQQSEKAADYFGKVQGKDSNAPKPWEKPAQPAPEAAPAPEKPAWAKPEAPLSEAEQYFKKILG